MTTRPSLERNLIGNLLGCAIAGRQEPFAQLETWFQADYLHDPLMRGIYRGLLIVHRQQQPPVAAVITRAIQDECRELRGARVPLAAEVARLIGEFCGRATGIWWHWKFYAEAIYEDWRRLRVADNAEGAASELRSQRTTVDESLEKLGRLSNRYAPPPAKRLDRGRDVFHELLDRIEGTGDEQDFPRTGLREVDAVFRHFAPGSVTVIGARTGEGKTSFLGHVAFHAALQQGRKVLLFSCEMGDLEIVERMVHWSSRQSNKRSPEYLAAIARLANDNPLQIIAGGSSIADIERDCQAHCGHTDVALVCVDYLGLVKPQGRFDTREQQVADISRRLKLLAQKCGVPFVVAAQLNRQASEGLPRKHHLRDSGAIEQDADNILLLAPNTKQKAAGDKTVETCIIVAKQRNGSEGVARVMWRLPMFRYENRASETEEG